MGRYGTVSEKSDVLVLMLTSQLNWNPVETWWLNAHRYYTCWTISHTSLFRLSQLTWGKTECTVGVSALCCSCSSWYLGSSDSKELARSPELARSIHVVSYCNMFMRIPTVFIRVSVGDWQLVQLVWKTITSLATRALSTPASAVSSSFSPVMLLFCVCMEKL